MRDQFSFEPEKGARDRTLVARPAARGGDDRCALPRPINYDPAPLYIAAIVGLAIFIVAIAIVQRIA